MRVEVFKFCNNYVMGCTKNDDISNLPLYHIHVCSCSNNLCKHILEILRYYKLHAPHSKKVFEFNFSFENREINKIKQDKMIESDLRILARAFKKYYKGDNQSFIIAIIRASRIIEKLKS